MGGLTVGAEAFGQPGPGAGDLVVARQQLDVQADAPRFARSRTR